jgi:hypothetical protein
VLSLWNLLAYPIHKDPTLDRTTSASIWSIPHCHLGAKKLSQVNQQKHEPQKSPIRQAHPSRYNKNQPRSAAVADLYRADKTKKKRKKKGDRSRKMK